MSFTVQNRTRRRLLIQLAQDSPEELEVQPMTCQAQVAPGRTVDLEFRLTAHQRGTFPLGPVFVRVLPAIGLLYRQFRLDLSDTVEVFPNLMNVRRTELLARRGMSYEQGLARLRSIGQGYEFESLRRYVQGDDMSRIEWKVTARRADLIVKNFEPERQQNILVAIDVGRATAGEFEGLSRVDYLVNATLMLAYRGPAPAGPVQPGRLQRPDRELPAAQSPASRTSSGSPRPCSGCSRDWSNPTTAAPAGSSGSRIGSAVSCA